MINSCESASWGANKFIRALAYGVGASVATSIFARSVKGSCLLVTGTILAELVCYGKLLMHFAPHDLSKEENKRKSAILAQQIVRTHFAAACVCLGAGAYTLFSSIRSLVQVRGTKKMFYLLESITVLTVFCLYLRPLAEKLMPAFSWEKTVLQNFIYTKSLFFQERHQDFTSFALERQQNQTAEALNQIRKKAELVAIYPFFPYKEIPPLDDVILFKNQVYMLTDEEILQLHENNPTVFSFALFWHLLPTKQGERILEKWMYQLWSQISSSLKEVISFQAQLASLAQTKESFEESVQVRQAILSSICTFEKAYFSLYGLYESSMDLPKAQQDMKQLFFTYDILRYIGRCINISFSPLVLGKSN